VGKSTSWYPSLSVDATGRGVVSQAGAVTLVRQIRPGLSTSESRLPRHRAAIVGYSVTDFRWF
jgi:hypothetical protein